MIASLNGIIQKRFENSVVINVSGVGYRALCSRKTLESLPEEGQEALLLTEMLVRQDMMQLYGFASIEEQSWFSTLITVQGVGMRVALAMLSALTPADLYAALTQQDKTLLCQADGVGPKLAARIVNELKDKAPTGAVHVVGGSSEPVVSDASVVQEAVSALVNLGYKRQAAMAACTKKNQDNDQPTTVEGLIRDGLSVLSRG